MIVACAPQPQMAAFQLHITALVSPSELHALVRVPSSGPRDGWGSGAGFGPGAPRLLSWDQWVSCDQAALLLVDLNHCPHGLLGRTPLPQRTGLGPLGLTTAFCILPRAATWGSSLTS